MIFKGQVVHGPRRGEIIDRDLPDDHYVVIHKKPEGVGDDEYYSPDLVPGGLNEVKVGETFEVFNTKEVFRLIEVVYKKGRGG